MLKKCLLLIFLVFVPVFLYSGIGIESFQFLKINPDARGASINDGFVAVADSANSLYYNPAGLTSLDNIAVSLMHMMYFAETSYEYAALGIPLGDKLKAAISIAYLNYGSIDLTAEDSLGVYTGSTSTFNPYNLALTGGLGFKLTKTMSLGASLKYALEDIAGGSSSGIMADAGVKLNTEDFLLGAAIYNVGSSSDGGSTPLMGRVGIASRFTLVDPSDLTVAGGVNYILASGKGSGSVGAEYIYESSLVFRGSYEMGKDINGMNVGIGLKSNMGDMGYCVDYNLAFLGTLGTTHRISLTVGEATEEKSTKRRPTQRNNGIRRYGIK